MALNIVIILLNPSCSVQEEFYFRTLFISTILINLTIAGHTRLGQPAPLNGSEIGQDLEFDAKKSGRNVKLMESFYLYFPVKILG